MLCNLKENVKVGRKIFIYVEMFKLNTLYSNVTKFNCVVYRHGVLLFPSKLIKVCNLKTKQLTFR